MHPDALPVATMKAALLRTNEELSRATAQAGNLREVMERMAVADLAAATEERDGSPYVQVLSQTCTALDALRAAYAALQTTIQRRTAAAATTTTTAATTTAIARLNIEQP